MSPHSERSQALPQESLPQVVDPLAEQGCSPGRCRQWPVPAHSLVVAETPGVKTVEVCCPPPLTLMLVFLLLDLQTVASSSHLRHLWRLGPLFCEPPELEHFHGNDLLPLWWAQTFPWTPCAMSYKPIQIIFTVANPGLSLGRPPKPVWSPSPHHHCRHVSHLLAGKCCSSVISKVSSLHIVFQVPIAAFPPEVLKFPLTPPLREFPSVWKFFFLYNSLPGYRSPTQSPLFLFYIYLLPYLILVETGLLFGESGVFSPSVENVFYRNCSTWRWVFDVFVCVWGRCDLPV